MPEPVAAALAVVLVVVAMLVDGRRSVGIATFAVALALLQLVVSAAGGPGIAVLAAACAAVAGLGSAAAAMARHSRWVAGLDPLVPVFAPARQLFGPRSVRLWCAALAIPAASWLSLFVPIGQVTSVQGQLFPIAYAWTCGVLRIFVARTLEDVAVGAAIVGIASGAAWMARGGDAAIGGAAALAALAPAAGAAAAWLRGRHGRRAVAV